MAIPLSSYGSPRAAEGGTVGGSADDPLLPQADCWHSWLIWRSSRFSSQDRVLCSAVVSRSLTLQFQVVELLEVFKKKKSAEDAGSPSASVHGHSSSSTPAAHHDGAVHRYSLWVQIMADDDDSYFWNRLDRTSHWVMPPGVRPGWVRTLDGLLVHMDTNNVLRSISGMH